MSMCSLGISQIIYVFSSALNPGNKGTAPIKSRVPVVVTITFDFVWHSPLTGLHFCYIFRYIYTTILFCAFFLLPDFLQFHVYKIYLD